jgi:hypothetical protein
MKFRWCPCCRRILTAAAAFCSVCLVAAIDLPHLPIEQAPPPPPPAQIAVASTSIGISQGVQVGSLPITLK